MKLSGLLPTCLLLSAGCVATGPRSPSAELDAAGGRQSAFPEEASNPILDTQTIRREGLLLLRPTTNSLLLHQGDSPSFFLEVPDGATRLRAHAEWSPPQQMGLEFRPPSCSGPNCRFTSWDDDHFRSLTTVNGPIDMEIDAPAAGTWYVYLGPGIAGGLVTWSLALESTLPKGSQARVEDAGSAENPADPAMNP